MIVASLKCHDSKTRGFDCSRLDNEMRTAISFKNGQSDCHKHYCHIVNYEFQMPLQFEGLTSFRFSLISQCIKEGASSNHGQISNAHSKKTTGVFLGNRTDRLYFSETHLGLLGIQDHQVDPVDQEILVDHLVLVVQCYPAVQGHPDHLCIENSHF